VEHARHLASDALRVSCADRVHNAWAILRDVRTVSDATWGRFNASPSDVLWYYQSLVVSYREAGGGPLVDELARIVRGLEGMSGRAGGPSLAAVLETEGRGR
jgi:hypothetical protein